MNNRDIENLKQVMCCAVQEDNVSGATYSYIKRKYNEIIRELRYNRLYKNSGILRTLSILFARIKCKRCSFTQVSMLNLLGGAVSTYPVGVFNVNGDFLGVAANQAAYIALWNADIDNQAQGTLEIGDSSSAFRLPNTSTITEVIGLRYYQYTGPANLQLFVGPNDIVHYGSTLKKGNVDGIAITTTTRKEWNRNLFAGVYKSTIPADTVYTLNCTSYVDSATLRVFHNEDSEYVAVSNSNGFYTITGQLPLALKATFFAGKITTQYGLVTNWAELTNLFSWFCFSTGGTTWGFSSGSFPSTLNKSLLTQLSVGEETNFPESLTIDYPYITAANFPILQDLVVIYNTGDGLTGSEAWFLTMPKVTNYFRYNTQTATQVVAATADAIWNNVATALSGVVPSGPAKELRILRTNNITAASLTSRNALISAGWTVTTN